MFDFTKQTAIITGGTRGIGRGIAEAFLKAGGHVIATYSGNTETAEKFRADNQDHSEQLKLAKFDIADIEQVEQFFNEFADSKNSVEVIVNNAGIRRDAVLPSMKKEDWDRVLNVNLGGTFHMCKHGVRAMMPNRYGRIINITSPCSHFGFAGQANYAASKAGQIALSRSLSKEVASRGITVNCISPGFIDTELIADLPEKLRKTYLDQVPLKRFGKVEDVAHAVLFLATKEAAYITGTTLEVCGGL